MTEHERAILLSVRPQYAQSILAGTKTAEIRRQRPDIDPGIPVIIYATKPVGAVIGTACIDRIYAGTPARLWQQHQDHLGISRDEFDQYLHGIVAAYVLMLTSPRRLAQPLTLDQMRESAAFQPPRSYRYVNHSALSTLVNGHPSGSALLSLLQPLLTPADAAAGG